MNSTLIKLTNNLKKVTYKCPPNYFLSPLGNSCYQFQFQPMTWQLAQQYCVMQGGWLVTVNDAIEHMILHSYQDYFQGANVWIGFSDLASKGSFKWTHPGSSYGSEPSVYPWCVGQPDNAGNNEDCVTLYDTTSGSYGVFNDWPCDKSFKYICESDVIATLP